MASEENGIQLNATIVADDIKLNAHEKEHFESYPMVGGNEEYSYARNSSRQKRIGAVGSNLVAAAIANHLDLKTSMKIADLGCSVGPNTFESMKVIIEAIQEKRKSQNVFLEMEFLVFFNDHLTNDFNSLFINLPSDRPYFATAIPGSFHTRLFPKQSMHLMYSSMSLQWLSKAPKELSNSNSPAYNIDRIFSINAPPPVCDAYSDQFRQDVDAFLGARGEELIPGGLMLLIVPGRANGTPPSHYSTVAQVFMPLEAILLGMAKEQMEMFNMPLYFPSPEELAMSVERNPGLEIVELKVMVDHNYSLLLTKQELRAGFEGLLSNCFGNEIVEELFDRYQNHISSFGAYSNTGEFRGVVVFVVLRRKIA